ncbi:MAG: hypothetical protein AB1489_19465 [Acidobacteriota bacterium]
MINVRLDFENGKRAYGKLHPGGVIKIRAAVWPTPKAAVFTDRYCIGIAIDGYLEGSPSYRAKFNSMVSNYYNRLPR